MTLLAASPPHPPLPGTNGRGGTARASEVSTSLFPSRRRTASCERCTRLERLRSDLILQLTCVNEENISGINKFPHRVIVAPIITDKELDMPSRNRSAAMPFDHVGLSVADLSRSQAFYRDFLAFDVVEDRFTLAEHGLRGMVLTNEAGGRLELFEKQGAVPRPVARHPADGAALHGWFQTAFRTDDVEREFARLVSAGAAAVLQPFTAPDGRSRVAFIADPDGNLIELVERVATSEKILSPEAQ